MRSVTKEKLMKQLTLLVLAGAACVLPFQDAQAAPLKKQAKTLAAGPTQYLAKCGMVYSAADAKKDHYICPMDGKKMTAIKPSAKTGAKHS